MLKVIKMQKAIEIDKKVRDPQPLSVFSKRNPMEERNPSELEIKVLQKGDKRKINIEYREFGVFWRLWKERRILEFKSNEVGNWYLVEVTPDEAQTFQEKGYKLFKDENAEKEVKLKRYINGEYVVKSNLYVKVNSNDELKDLPSYIFEKNSFDPIVSP